MVLARHLAAGLVGVAAGTAAVLVHRHVLAGLPAGLLLALLASFATAFALRVSRAPRLTATFAAGWVVAFGVFIAGRSEGDYAIAADVPGYVLMGGALALVLVGVTAFSRRPPRSDTRQPHKIRL